MTRAQILSEARDLFARKGYADTSLREIAQAVGIKTPSLYAHFTGKEALYAEVYEQVGREHAAYFEELANESADLPPLERLRHLLDGIEAYYRGRPDLAEFSLRAAIAESGPVGGGLREMFLDSEGSLADAIRDAFRAGVTDGSFRTRDEEGFVALFLVLMDGLFLHLTHYTPEVYAERHDRAWTSLSGLLTGGTS